MKNFYQILEIEPQADKQTIRAAYKRLMREYHPDLVGSERRDDPGLLEKVQEINEAYDVLSDDEKRKAYDRVLKEAEAQKVEALSPFEKRTLLVRCARNRRTYKMFLARKKGTTARFQVTGFEAFDKPLLPVRTDNLLRIVADNLRGKTWEISRRPQTQPANSSAPVSGAENLLGIADILWNAQSNCPDCGTQVSKADGTAVHWFVCSYCKHLFCPGKITTTFLNRTISWCPWCGREARINLRKSGTKKMWRIRGQEHTDTREQPQKQLAARKPKALGDGKKK